jgi:hypothetical protein
MKPRYGFRCQSCGSQGNKILFGVELKWAPRVSSADSENGPPVIRNINICKRCMKRFGLIEREPRE